MRIFFQVFVFAFLSTLTLGIEAAAQSQGNLNRILGGQARGKFYFHEMNVNNQGAFALVTLDNRLALQMKLEYGPYGPDLDWNRHGTPGFAQRFQVAEAIRSGEMRVGNEYWYRFSFYMPSFPRVTNHSMDIFDIKPRFSFGQAAPVFSLQVQPAGMRIVDAFQKPMECGPYTNSNGGTSHTCNRFETFSLIGSQNSFSNRWVDVVMHAKWSNNPDGIFRLWIDGKSIMVYHGDTGKGANLMGFKVGPYRHHMRSPIGPVTLYYADIVRSSSCEKLGISTCVELEASGSQVGYHRLGYDVDTINALTTLRANPNSTN